MKVYNTLLRQTKGMNLDGCLVDPGFEGTLNGRGMNRSCCGTWFKQQEKVRVT